MYEAFIVLMGLAIAYQSYRLITTQKRLDKEIRDLIKEVDRNIDFSGDVGSGISLTRKNYPEMKDDFRESSDADK